MTTPKKTSRREARPGEGNPKFKGAEPRGITPMIRVKGLWHEYIQEQARRRGEPMGDFIEHVLKMYRDNPPIL